MDAPISEIKNTFIERSKSTLFGSIALSWVAFNWEVVLTLLLSNKSIELIITQFNLVPIETALFYPVLSGAFIAIVSPSISHIPWETSHYFEKLKREKTETLISEEEALKLHNNINLLNSSVRRKEAEIHETTQAASNKLQKIIDSNQAKYSESINGLNKELNTANTIHQEEVQTLETELRKEHSDLITELKSSYKKQIKDIEHDGRLMIEEANILRTDNRYLKSYLDSSLFNSSNSISILSHIIYIHTSLKDFKLHTDTEVEVVDYLIQLSKKPHDKSVTPTTEITNVLVKIGFYHAATDLGLNLTDAGSVLLRHIQRGSNSDPLPTTEIS